MLFRSGLKTELARRLQVEHKELAAQFAELLLEMIALRNPGTKDTWKSTVETVSVLDVFRLLQKFPRRYLANSKRKHTASIRGYLKPVFRGNRFHIAKKQAVVAALINRFSNLYRELMSVCAGYAREYYGDFPRLQASIIVRSGFENEPLDFLYARKLREELKKAIAAYRATGNPQILRAAIDQRVAASMRSVDGLLAQGNSRRLTGGGVELEMRTIDGINYSVRAWNDDAQTRRLHVSIALEQHANTYLTSLPHLPRLTRRQIETLRYRYTTDGWKNSGVARASLTRDERGGLSMEFDVLCAAPLVGRLKGFFCWRGNDGPGSRKTTPRFGGYVFAIPDRLELIGLLTTAGDGCSA